MPGFAHSEASTIVPMDDFPDSSSTSQSPDAGRKIWRGGLLINWDTDNIIVPLMASALNVPGYPRMVNANFWPSQIVCNVADLAEVHEYFMHITHSTTEWMAQFRLTDVNDSSAQLFARLVGKMESANTFFRTNCSIPGYNISVGTLYFFCTAEKGLVGVYHPNSAMNRASFPISVSNRNSLLAGNYSMDADNGLMIPFQGVDTSVWAGYMQLCLRGSTQNFHVNLLQCNMAQAVGILGLIDTSKWPYSFWCAKSNMYIESPLLEILSNNSNEWVVRLSAMNSSVTQTESILRSLAVFMQARRLMFRISCGYFRGDELMLYLFGVTHPTFGNVLVGGLRTIPIPPELALVSPSQE